MGAPRWSVPAVHVPLFLALSLGWMVVVNIVLVGFLLYEVNLEPLLQQLTGGADPRDAAPDHQSGTCHGLESPSTVWTPVSTADREKDLPF